MTPTVSCSRCRSRAARRTFSSMQRNGLRCIDEKVRLAALDLHREQLTVGVIGNADVLAMLHAVLKEAHPRRDVLAVDFLIPASHNGNTGPGDDHYPPLGDVILELANECISIHAEPLADQLRLNPRARQVSLKIVMWCTGRPIF